VSGDRNMPDAPVGARGAPGRTRGERSPSGHEEIGRHDLADVIPHKRAPRLRGRRSSVAHGFGDGRLTDVDPQFQQFAMNPRCTSPRVRLRHRANQPADVRRYAWSPMQCRLFHVHHSRNPCRCQAMTVSGLTITSDVRHSVQMRESMTQRNRSVLKSRNRAGRVRCNQLSQQERTFQQAQVRNKEGAVATPPLF
jgi:hypothetical protein